jgi:hypothetical protein
LPCGVLVLVLSRWSCLSGAKLFDCDEVQFFLGYELLLNGNNSFKVEVKESLVIMAQSRTTLKKTFQILLNLKKKIIFLPLVPKTSHNIKMFLRSLLIDLHYSQM